MTTPRKDQHGASDDLAIEAVDADEETEQPLVIVDETSRALLAEQQETLAALAVIAHTAPPLDLRQRVLHSAFSQRLPTNHRPSQALGVDAYLEACEALSAMLGAFDDSPADHHVWQCSVSQTWTIREVIIHLTVLDHLTLDVLNSNSATKATSATLATELVNIAAATTQAIHAQRHASSASIVQTWRTQTQQLAGVGRAALENTQSTYEFFGVPLQADQVLADRAFETWLHTQDIRKALGRGIQTLSPSGLLALTDLGARMLPFALTKSLNCGLESRPNKQTRQRSARLVLTGEGGGTWLVPFDPTRPPVEPTATVRLDAVDFCLLIGNWLTPENIAHSSEGDLGVVQDVLHAAPMLARV